MLNVKGWVDIQKLSSTIKPGSVGTVTEEIKKCMSLLQRNINVVKSGDLLNKLEDIAYETKLKFMHAQIGEVEEVFLSSDVFYIEIQFNTVNLDILTVKIALNNLEPQDSASLLQALKNKNYDLFCNHIELYNQIYLISDDKTIKPKIYTSLIVIETFIEQSFRNYTFNHKSLVELCNNSKYGYVLTREGGQNMKLFYYITPIEAINLKSSDNINDTTANEFENSVLVTMVRDDTNVHCLPLTIESLNAQINSETPKHDDIIMDESFFTCNATYALTFPTNPIIIGSDIGEEIQKITGLKLKINQDVSNDLQSKLYLSALFTQFYERYGRNSSFYKGVDIDDIDWENGNVCFKVPIKANISILALIKPSDYTSFSTTENTMETNNNNDDEFQLQDTTGNLTTEFLYFTLHNHCKKEVFKGENVSSPLLSQTIKCIPFTNVCQLIPLINLLRRSTIYNALIGSCFRILCNTNENKVENSTAAQNDDKDNLKSLTFAVTLGDKSNTLNITTPNIYLLENLSDKWEISIIIVEPITIKITLDTNNFDSNTIKQVLESLCLKMEDILKKSLSIPCLMKYFIEHIGNYGQALINEKTKVSSDVKLQNSSYFFADEENENFEDIGQNSLDTVYKTDLTKISSNVCTKTSDTLTKSNYESGQNLLDRNDIDNGLKFIYSEPKTTTLPSKNLQKTNKILPLSPSNDKNSIDSNILPILDDSSMDFESTNLSLNAKPNIDMANALLTEHTSVSIAPNSKSNIVNSSSISFTNENSTAPNVVSSSKRRKHSQTSLITQGHFHNTTKDKTNENGTQVKNKVVTNVNLESNNQNILPAPIFSTNFKIPKKSSSPRETLFPSFGAPILANATSSPVTANAGAPSSLLSSLSKNHRKSSLSAVIDKLKSNTASPNNNTGLSLSNNSNSIAPKSNIFSHPFGTSIGNNTSSHSSPLQRSLSYQSTRNNDKGAENSTGTMSKGLSNNGGGNTSSKKHLSTSTIINSNVISLMDDEPLNVSSSSKGLLGTTTNKTNNPPPSAPIPCLDKLSKLLAAKTAAAAVRGNTNVASTSNHNNFNSSKGAIAKGGGTDGGSPSSSILLPPIKMTISKRASSDGSLKVVSSVIQPASCPESGTTSTSNFVTNESQLTDETANNTNNTRMKNTNQMGDKDERKNYELALMPSSAAHRAHSDEDIRFDN